MKNAYDKIRMYITLGMRELRCLLFGHEYISIDRECQITVCIYCGKDYVK